jgi:hypothetical protein
MIIDLFDSSIGATAIDGLHDECYKALASVYREKTQKAPPQGQKD